jgi:fumarate reductase flavoprotein subunit
MHKKTTSLTLAMALASTVAFGIFMIGCQNSSSTAANNAKPASTARVVPPMLVTNPPGTGKTAAGMPSMDKHASHGVTCEQCHDTAAPTSAPNSNKACLGCHDSGSLIKATLKYDNVANKSQNPHDSHIHGASCLVCHKNHSASVLYCDECHQPKFGWKVP